MALGTAGAAVGVHTHPTLTHEHPHAHPMGPPGARRTDAPLVAHSHVHTHPSVTHVHRLDLLQEYAWHHLMPHGHAHEDRTDRVA